MAGLVLIILVVFSFTTSLYNTRLSEVEAQRKAYEKSANDLERIKREVVDGAKPILDLRTRLFNRIQRRLGAEHEIDEHGTLRLTDDTQGNTSSDARVMFPEGSDRLTPHGQRLLDEVMPAYLEAVLGDEDDARLVEAVIIEGHTNSNYRGGGGPDQAYLHNLDLSQRRASAAMRHVLEKKLGIKDNMRDKLMASGFSSSRLIKTQAGVEDQDRSRRIEIRFRLKDEETLRKLEKIFSKIKTDGAP